jgi:hypothetical protein
MRSKIGAAARSGVAMMLVLALSVVILAVGMSMIGLTGSVMSASVDAKTKIKARYAAESSISASIANAVYQAGNYFGGSISASTLNLSEAGDNGTANVSSGNNMGQEEILEKNSPMNGMRGNQIPLQISASGKSGGAKAKIVAAVALYQVPIYQFGVFYDGPLEITPGSNMTVMGRVHTNSSAYFRGATVLAFQGPITAVGNIYQWQKTGTSGVLNYQLTPDTSAIFAPGPLNQTLVAMTSASNSQPPPIGGVSNAEYMQSPLILPIGVGTAHSILGIRDSINDPPALRRQKFDWLVATRSSAAARWVVLNSTVPAKPAWITGPRVFYDRREQRWVKVWDFDVSALAASGNQDSIFYLDDTTTTLVKVPSDTHAVLNAFRIKNATWLPRNMTIACGKPVYIMGDFNKQNSTGDTTKYMNAQIAADAVTVLSGQWMSWDTAKFASSGIAATASSLERPWSDANWLACTGCSSADYARTPTGGALAANIRINAAIITGNKQSSPNCFPPINTSDAGFESCYEGGWHNSLRFLEQWGGPPQRSVVFLGSYVCMWQAQTPELATGATVYSTSYYSVPVRVWGYDTRFNDLSNMPPGSPFLATAILTNWLERN